MGMRRADRLFQIIQILRRGTLVTAQDLARELEVSTRTIYRDIQDLMASGVPIEGEAGMGYLMSDGFDLPPVMFTREEIKALVVSARIMKTWADPGLVRAFDSALEKIHQILPEERSEDVEISVFAPGFNAYPKENLGLMREALERKRQVRLFYTRGDGAFSKRLVNPLGLFFWGNRWTLVAWCLLRDDFRHFRIDRIQKLDLLESFEDQPGQTLEDFYATIPADARES